MKHKLFILMTIFGLLLFSNCQTEEDYIEHGKDAYENFEIKRLSRSEFKRAAPKAFGKTEELNLQQSSHAKGVAVNDFTVETDEVIQITKGDIVSYTLSVYRDEPNDFVENLVLTQKPDGNYIARLVSYDLTEQEKETLSSGAFLDVTNKISTHLLENGNAIGTSLLGKGSSSDCFSLETHYDMCCHNVHSTLDIMNGADCTCSNPPTGYTFVISVVPCGYDGGGFGMPGDTSPVGTGPSNGDGSSGGGGTTNPTNPQNPNPQDPEDGENPSNIQEPEDSFEEPTLPLILTKPVKKTPCEELNRMMANTNIRNSFTGANGLESKVGEIIEYGNAFKRGANFDIPEPIARDPAKPAVLDMNKYVGGNYYGANHIHPNPVLTEYIPMFPAPDIDYLDKVALKYDWNGLAHRDRDYSIFVLTLTTPNGTFAIKIKDWLKFRLVKNNEKEYKKMKRAIERKFKKIGPSNTNNLIKALLKTMHDFDLGIGLYKAEPDFSNWNELTLSNPNNESSEIVATPCTE